MKNNINLNLATKIVLTILLSLTTLSFATNYYVDQNHQSASDSNPGTLNSPWKTIQHAAETAVAGDTVFIRAGNYPEGIYFDHSGNQTSGYIVFTAFPGEKPIIDGTGNTDASNGIVLDKAFIKLIGLEVANWASNALWLEGASHFEISDCEVHDVPYGIGVAYGSHDFVFNRTVAHHFDLYGFDVSPNGIDCYNGTFNDCIAHTGRDRDQNVDGFALGHGTQHDFVFNRCTTYDVFDGFDISSGNTTLNQCLAYNCWNGNYKLWQDNVKLINCIGHSCPGSNVELDWDGQPGTTWLINCTFFNASTYTVWVENTNDRLRMYNCILAGGDNIGLAFEQMGVSNYEGDYNIFHNDNPYRAVAVAYSDEFTLDQVKNGDWTTYSGQDAHSIVENSDANLFVDPADFDLHLIESSPAVDHARSDLAPSIDFDGNPRPIGNGFDIGAYEYQLPVRVNDNKKNSSVSESFVMFQNFPNPFNPQTRIQYQLARSAEVRLEIFNLLGKKVITLINEKQTAGIHSTSWDGKDSTGNQAASGVYFYRLLVKGKGNNYYFTRKMVKLQ
ncbi:MAG: right-handed parallel beta-helix repeat-containing protein [bacterium]|nr:right-handed parallel beta-helix repeat-containing protein [bacterium]